MTRKLAPLALAAAIAAGAAGAFAPSAFASAPGRGPCPDGPDGPRWEHRGGPGERLAALGPVLNLTEDQKTRIRGLFEAEGAELKPPFDGLRSAREAFRKAAGAAPFDEAAVRAAAQKEAAARVEMDVARARVRSKVHAVLTPEQQTLLEKLRPLLHERGPRGGGDAF